MEATTRQMARHMLAAIVFAALGATWASGTTIQGSLRYAGMPVHATFTTMTSGVSGVYDFGASEWTSGTVNLAGDSYSIAGLAAGTYGVNVRLSTVALGQDVSPAPGDLYGGVLVTVGSEPTIIKDLDLGYAVHVTQPLDSATRWTGSCSVCPKGAEVAKTFTLAWEPVPLATSYAVSVRRAGCTDELLSVDTQTLTTTSVQITQQTAPGEDHMLVLVDAFSGATQLTVQPFVQFPDCSWQAHVFHAAASAGGRQIHPTNSRFLAQVAHLSGQPPTFWTTYLFLTNPTATPVTAKLRFTPRDVDGTTTYFETQVDVPAHASRTIADVVDALFHTSGAGSLEIEPAALEVACRNATPGAGPGQYGQGFIPMSADQIVWLGGPSQRLGTGGVAKGAYRSNLSLTEVWGEAVDLRVLLLDRDGATVGQQLVSLLPFGTTQINDVVAKLGGPSSIEEAQVVVEVTSGGGRVGAVLSLVDNGSQDPSTLPLGRR